MSLEAIFKKYDFRWEVLDGMIGGKSIVDTQEGLIGFPMKTLEDADQFVRSYGYHLDDPIENAEALGNFHEALNFIRKYFLKPENPDGLAIEVPRKILELNNISDLLLMAAMNYPGQLNDPPGMALRNWACAILKVVHSIAHMDKDVRYSYFGEIQTQILDRFYKIVHRDADENLFIGRSEDDPLRVNLVAFETKPKKSRDSLLIKVLHKQESLPDEVFDQVGLRFITKTRLDALRVVKCLKDHMIVIPANVKPSRSRNTLIDMETLRAGLKETLKRAEAGELDEAGVVERLTEATVLPENQSANPHSSMFYRSIQFTCRQLIKLKNPAFEDLRNLKTLAKSSDLSKEVASKIESIDLSYLQREIRFFYPYEAQVVDEVSHQENEKGLSAHSDYKKSQVQSAMVRVMGRLAEKKS